MQSIESAMTLMKTCADKRQFLWDFQFIRGNAPLVFNDLFVLSENTHRNVFSQPRVRSVKYGQNSIKFYGTSFWNKVPLSLRHQDAKSVPVQKFLVSFLERQSGIQNSIYK